MEATELILPNMWDVLNRLYYCYRNLISWENAINYSPMIKHVFDTIIVVIYWTVKESTELFYQRISGKN